MSLKATQGERTLIYGSRSNDLILPVKVDSDGRLAVALETAADDDTAALTTDRLSGTLATLPIQHYLIHQGGVYEVARFVLALGNNASIDLYFVVGADVWPHLVFMGAMGGDAELQLWENPTVSANGTQLTPRNLYRPSANTPASTVYHTPTITNTGTELLTIAVPGGRGNFASGGLARDEDEWVFDVGHTYLMRFFNRSGAARIASMEIEWYERDEA